jgi:hypothetical protein
MKSICLILIGWLLYAIAWFLPVHKEGVTLPKGLPGWEALLLALALLEEAETWYSAILSVTSAVTNLLILGSPLVVLRKSANLSRGFGWAALVAILINAHWYVLSEARQDLRIGYFLWWFAFVPVMIGLFRLSRQRSSGEPFESNLEAN